jgi:hypothetical protein
MDKGKQIESRCKLIFNYPQGKFWSQVIIQVSYYKFSKSRKFPFYVNCSIKQKNKDPPNLSHKVITVTLHADKMTPATHRHRYSVQRRVNPAGQAAGC